MGGTRDAATRLWLDAPPLQAAAFAASPADPASDPAASREGGQHGGACAESARAAPCAAAALPVAPGRSALPGAAQDPAAGSAPPPARAGEGDVAGPAAAPRAGLDQGPASSQGLDGPPVPADPLLTRIAAGLLRVEGALPREALAAEWPAQAWRQARACLHLPASGSGECCMSGDQRAAGRRMGGRPRAVSCVRVPGSLAARFPACHRPRLAYASAAADLHTPGSHGPKGGGSQPLDGGAQAVGEAQCAWGLRAALAQLEAAVQAGFISPLFTRCLALVAGAWPSAGALSQSGRMPPALPRCLSSLCGACRHLPP